MVKLVKFIFFLLQGIPESSGLIALSLAMAKVPLRWGRIIAAGVIMALVAYYFRTMSFTVGLHTVVGLLLAVILITSTTRVPPTKAFVVVSISLIILGFLELLIFKSLYVLLKPQVSISDDVLRKLLALPQTVIIIISALLVPRFITPRQDAWKM